MKKAPHPHHCNELGEEDGREPTGAALPTSFLPVFTVRLISYVGAAVGHPSGGGKSAMQVWG